MKRNESLNKTVGKIPTTGLYSMAVWIALILLASLRGIHAAPQQMLVISGTRLHVGAGSQASVEASCVAPDLPSPGFSDRFSYSPSNLKAFVQVGNNKPITLAEAIAAGVVEVHGNGPRALNFLNRSGQDLDIEFREHAVLASDPSQAAELDLFQARYNGHDKENAWDVRFTWELEKLGLFGTPGIMQFQRDHGLPSTGRFDLGTRFALAAQMKTGSAIRAGLTRDRERVLIVENVRDETKPLFKVFDGATGRPIEREGLPFETDDLTAIRDFVAEENRSGRSTVEYVWFRGFDLREVEGAHSTFETTDLKTVNRGSFFSSDSRLLTISEPTQIESGWLSKLTFQSQKSNGRRGLNIRARVLEAVSTATDAIRGLFKNSQNGQNSVWAAAKAARAAVKQSAIERPDLKLAFIDEFGRSQFVFSAGALSTTELAYELHAMENSLRLADNN
jgi:hypothetical protein